MILFKPIKANSSGVPRAIAQNDSFGRTIMNKYGLIGSFNLGVLNLLFPELGDNEEQLAAEREHIYRYMVQLRTQLARRDDDGHRLLVMRSFLLKQMEKVWLKQFAYTHNKEKARRARAGRPEAITIRVVTDRTAEGGASARQAGRRSDSVGPGLSGRRGGEASAPAERGFGEGRLDRASGQLRLNRSGVEGRPVGRGVQMHRLLAALPRGLAFAAGRPGHEREAGARLARMAGRSALYRSAAAGLDQGGGIGSAPVRAGLRFVYAPEGADAPEGEAARARMRGAEPGLQDGWRTAQAALSAAYVRGMNQRRLHAALVEHERALYREPIAAGVWRGMERWSAALYGLRELAARRGREQRDMNRVHGRGRAALPPEAAGLVDRVAPPHAGGGVDGTAAAAEARLFRALMPAMLPLQGAGRYVDSSASFFPWNETRLRGAQQYGLLLSEVSPDATWFHVMQPGGRQFALSLTYRQLTDSPGMQWAVMQSALMDRQRLHSVWPGLPGRSSASAALLQPVAGHDAEHALASSGVRAHDVPLARGGAGKARVQLRFMPPVAAQLTASSAAWPTSPSPAGLRDISSGEGAAAQLQLAYADAAYSTRLSYHAPLSESVSERLGERAVVLRQLLRRDSERAGRVRPALGGHIRSAAAEGMVKAHVLAGQTLFADDLRQTVRRDTLDSGRDRPVAAEDAAFTRRLYYTPLHDHIRARLFERRNYEYTRIFDDVNSSISAPSRAASGQRSRGELSIRYTRPGQTRQLQPAQGQPPDGQGGLRAGDRTARPEDSLQTAALPQRADDRDIARLLLLYHMPLIDSVGWRTPPLAAGYAPPRGRTAAAQRAVAPEEARSDAYMSRSSAWRRAAAGSPVRLEHGRQSGHGAIAGRDAGLRRTGLLLRIRYAEQPAADNAAAQAARTGQIERTERNERTAEDSTLLAHRTANRRGAADTVPPQAAIVRQYAIDEAKTSDQQLYRAPLAQQVWRERLQWLTAAEPSLSRMLEHADYGDDLPAGGGDEAVWRRGRRRSGAHERTAQATRPGNVRVRFFAPGEDPALHPGQRQALPLADRLQAAHLSAPQAERMYRAPLADTVWTGQLSWLAAPLGQVLAADDARGSMPAVWRRRVAQRMAATGSAAADGHVDVGIAERLSAPGRMSGGIGLPVDLRHSGDADSFADADAARATIQAQFASPAERVRRLAEQPDAAGAGQARQSRREADEVLQLLRVSLARNVWTHRLRMLADRRLAALDNVSPESEDAGHMQPQVMFGQRLNRAASWLSRAARPDAEAAMYLTNYYMRHMATASRLARVAVAGDDFVDVFGGSVQGGGLSRRLSAEYSDSPSLERAYGERQNPLLTYALQMAQAVSGNVPAAGVAGMAEQRTALLPVSGGGARASLSEAVWTERLRMLSPTGARERGAAVSVAASNAARAARGQQQAGEQQTAQLAAWPQTPFADGPALTLPFADHTPERVNGQPPLAAYSPSAVFGNDSRAGQQEGLAALTQSFLKMWPYHKSRRPYRRAARYVRSFLQRHLLSDHPVAQRWLSVYDSGLYESALSVHSAADSDAANVGERRGSHPAATVKAPVQFVLPLPQTGDRPDEPQRTSRSAFAGERRARGSESGRRESAMYKRLLGALVDYAVDAAWPSEAAHRAARQQGAERETASTARAARGAAATAAPLPGQPKARGAAQRKMHLPPMLTTTAEQFAGRQPERRIGRQLEQQMERHLERSQQQQLTLPFSTMLSAEANRAIAAADGYAEGWPGAATAFAAAEELEWLIPSAGEQHDAVRQAGGSETTEGGSEGLQPLINALRRVSRSVDGPAVAALRQLAGGLLSGTQLKLLRSEVETDRWFGQQSALLSAKLPAQLSGVSKRPTTPGEARQVAAKLLTLYQTARAFAAAASAGASGSETPGGSGAAAPAGGLIVMPPTAADIGQAATASMLAAAPARDHAASAAMRDAAQALHTVARSMATATRSARAAMLRPQAQQPAAQAQARAAQARSPLIASGGGLALALAAPAASLLTQHNALAAAISSPLAQHNALAATPLTQAQQQRQQQQLGAPLPPTRAADWRPYTPAAAEAAEPPPDWPRLDYGAAPPDSTGAGAAVGYEAEAEQQRHPELSYSAPGHTQAQAQAQSDTGSSTTITPVQFSFEQPAPEPKPEPTSLDIEEIADRVYRELERKMRFEQQRRGF